MGTPHDKAILNLLKGKNIEGKKSPRSNFKRKGVGNEIHAK